MPTTNYDASELTRFRAARALFSFNKGLVNNEVNKQCVPEQGPPAINAVYTQRTTGGMARIVDGSTQVESCCPVKSVVVG
jgi:hypothetical protein